MVHAKGMSKSSLVNIVTGPVHPAFCCGCGDKSQVDIDPPVLAQTMQAMALSMEKKLEEMGLPIKDVLGDLNDFMGYYKDNPAMLGNGSTHLNRLLWLHIVARSLDSSLIVESGTHIGRSLWILQKACPNAELISFDIKFKKLKFTSHLIKYEEMDWSDSPVVAKSKSDLVFFDDNTNNCLRIRQAYEKGFRHIMFNSAPAPANLHSFRWPGVPTVPMLSYMQPGDAVRWHWHSKPNAPKKNHLKLEYVFDESHTYGARELIDMVVNFSSLEEFTGLNCPQHITYVRLQT